MTRSTDPAADRWRRVLFLAGAALLLWAIFALLFVPWLIRSAYAGESLPIVNRMITGQDQHGVDHYLSRWNRVALLATPLVIIAAAVAWSTRRAWARLPGHLRSVPAGLPGGRAGVLMFAIAVGAIGGLAEAVNGIVRHRVRHLPTGEYVAGELFWLVPLAAVTTLLVLSALLLALDRLFRTRGLFAGLACYLIVGLVVYSFMRALALGFANYAAVLLAAGAAAGVARTLVRHPVGWARALRIGVPALMLGLFAWAAIVPVSRRISDRRARNALPAAQADMPNVLILIWDAVRAPNMSLYGHTRPTTPSLERLAERGIVFERTFATAPWSLPSHAGIFTGRYPPEMTVGFNSPLDRIHPTLAEVLSAEGYVTGGFTGNLFFGSADYGIARGFAHYDSRPPLNVTTILHTWWASRMATLRVRLAMGRHQSLLRRNAAHVSASFERWLGRRGDRPFLAILNHFDAHEPYLPPEPFNLMFSDHQPRYWFADETAIFQDSVLAELQTAYDTSIRYIDSELQNLLDTLEREAELDHTLIIVTSDHGEEFGEHARGVVGHSKTLHKHALHVPLVIVPPGGTSAQRRAGVASIRDIPATVMDVLGLADRSPFPGEPLLRRGTDAPGADPWSSLRFAAMEKHRFGGGTGRWPSAVGDMFTLMAGDWHYILDGRHREWLFDMRNDPWEKRDLAADSASEPILERFRAALDTLAPEVEGVRRARGAGD
ncbi:MAG: sulfatase [Gemmatimonadetes bacterium]|nr:sulfatase [Gemmatimonadota bacterium]